MEQEVGINARPEEVAGALFAGDSPVVKPGKEEDTSMREFEGRLRWLKGGGISGGNLLGGGS